jgi:hypothetical protein
MEAVLEEDTAVLTTEGEEVDVLPEVVDEELPDNEAQEETEDSVVVTLGEESLSPEAEDEEYKSAPNWVKDLRKAHREEKRKSKELERKLKEMESAPARTTAPTEPLGKKPTLADFDYDSDRYEAALAGWFDRERAIEQEKKLKELEAKKQDEEYRGKLSHYENAKKKLNLGDFEDAEDAVLQTLSPIQQSIILNGAVDPALMVYAIGKSKKRADELSKISDPVKFAVEIGKLETQLKVTRRSTKPAPEKVVTGTSARNSGGVDKHLDKLRAEADKSGDRSKVVAYMRQLKAKKPILNTIP